MLAPRIVGPGLRIMQPISRMKQSQTRLEQLEAQSSWGRPAADTLTAEQLDRFEKWSLDDPRNPLPR